jgi:hypothetical protein
MDETFPKMAALNNAEKNIRVLLSIRKQKMRKICKGISSLWNDAVMQLFYTCEYM